MKQAMVAFETMPWDLFLARLALAATLGALVGLERERHERPAGLRTHLLVSTGSCLFTMVSIVMAGKAFDPGRVAAGIITGLGFLGAGTIIRERGSVRGLTTAASIWAVAGIGMAAAIGWWQAGLTATVLMVLSLAGLKRIEGGLHRERDRLCLRIALRAGARSLAQLHTDLEALGCEPTERGFSAGQGGDPDIAVLELENLPRARLPEIMERLARLEGVLSVSETPPTAGLLQPDR